MSRTMSSTPEPPTDEDITAAPEVEQRSTANAVWTYDSRTGQATGWYPSAGGSLPEQHLRIGHTASYSIGIGRSSATAE